MLTFSLLPNSSSGQANYDAVKSALILQLSEHVIWPNEAVIDPYQIGFVGIDSSTFNIIKHASTKQKLKGKTFQVSWVSSLSTLGNTNILYVDKAKSTNLDVYAHAIENHNILLISEQSEDTKNIMLNIERNVKSKKVSFEVNKANIIIENLNIDPELLLLGGTEVNIRELYREIKSQYEQEASRATQQSQTITRQQQRLESQTERIGVYEQSLDQLQADTELLKEQIAEREKNLDTLSLEVEQKKQSIVKQSTQLRLQEAQISGQTHELAEQRKSIENRKVELDELTTKSEEQKATIENQTFTLEAKENLIKLQEILIYITIALVIIFVVLGIIIFRYYRLKQLLANKLKNSYSKLNEQHKSILHLNEELNAMNEALEGKVKERTIVLEERNTQLSEYAFINSHLLRAPLSQILGISHLLSKQELNIDDQKLVDALLTASDDLDKIIYKINELIEKGDHFSREEVQSIIDNKLRDIKKD